jgi:hypothetical protein
VENFAVIIEVEFMQEQTQWAETNTPIPCFPFINRRILGHPKQNLDPLYYLRKETVKHYFMIW